MAGQFELRGANGDCTVCGCRPRDEKDRNGPALPMVVWIGGDVNWGDDLNLCQNCVRVMGQLIGMEDPDEVAGLKKSVKQMKGELKKAREAGEKNDKLLARIRDGREAVKEAKAA